MTKKSITQLIPILVVTLMVTFAVPARLSAHCDGIDGPVVKAAREALRTGELNFVLIWVQRDDEIEISKAFQQTLAVRKLGPAASDLADRFFFETLVRLHRAGEGEPYTGLKPAGRELGPVIPAVDRALGDGDIQPLLRLFPTDVHNEIRKRFQNAIAAQEYRKTDVAAGRKFVGAYVSLMHHAEELYGGTNRSGAAHVHGSGHEKQQRGKTMTFRTPAPLKSEHEELHTELVRLLDAPGRVGEATKAVARLLHPHFVKEEEYALPPLGLLEPLANGKLEPAMVEALLMTDRLKADLPVMLQEHEAVIAALEDLIEAAEAEGKTEHVHFAEKLMLHARTEEEVLYPASLLVGEYLKLRFDH